MEKEGACNAPVVRKTERLPCKEQRRHRSAIDVERPGDRSNAYVDYTRVARNRLRGIRLRLVTKERDEMREGETRRRNCLRSARKMRGIRLRFNKHANDRGSST
jgi:hypothetical protein